MNIDTLVFEIGSTTTVVNAFNLYPTPIYIGQGQAATTVTLGDVTVGLNHAISNLKENLGIDEITYHEVFATSSAAGGLRMTVHGLVHDMTVKAAKEAALGAGANLQTISSGKLSLFDLGKLVRVKPNIILIAGGVDYGERETALYNAEQIANLRLNIPVVYAGNCENQDEIRELFRLSNQLPLLHVVSNVYPKIDQLHVEPTRRVIQKVFEEHITKAPGMEKVKEIVNQHLIPTPGAVMGAAELLEEELGDLLVFDVGGATTDVHSVTLGNEKIKEILIHPEPKAKRTVEGDLGLYVNKDNLIERIGKEKLAREIGVSMEELQDLIASYEPIPKDKQIPLVERLTLEALLLSLDRHAGNFRHLYGTKGRTKVAEGKDLTSVKTVVGTGGALTRLPHRIDILEGVLNHPNPSKLVPSQDATILIDHHYIMASLGVLALKYPKEAKELLKSSLDCKGA